jgi:hypothetical protein
VGLLSLHKNDTAFECALHSPMHMMLPVTVEANGARDWGVCSAAVDTRRVAATQGAAVFTVQSALPDDIDISVQWEPLAADPLVGQGSMSLGPMHSRERMEAPLSSSGARGRGPAHSLSIDSDSLFADMRAETVSPQVSQLARRRSAVRLTRLLQSHGIAVFRAGPRDTETIVPTLDDSPVAYARRTAAEELRGFASPPPPVISLLRPRQTLHYQVRRCPSCIFPLE